MVVGQAETNCTSVFLTGGYQVSRSVQDISVSMWRTLHAFHAPGGPNLSQWMGSVGRRDWHDGTDEFTENNEISQEQVPGYQDFSPPLPSQLQQEDLFFTFFTVLVDRERGGQSLTAGDWQTVNIYHWAPPDNCNQAQANWKLVITPVIRTSSPSGTSLYYPVSLSLRLPLKSITPYTIHTLLFRN